MNYSSKWKRNKRHPQKIYIKRYYTFSTTEVSLKVKYNPVISDENRLPYSLFKKKRYQTGAGSKARYNRSMYSTKVSIWPWKVFCSQWVMAYKNKISVNSVNLNKCTWYMISHSLPVYDNFCLDCSYSTLTVYIWKPLLLAVLKYLKENQSSETPQGSEALTIIRSSINNGN